MAAREDYGRKSGELEYLDVKKDPRSMQRMLELNGGVREVPTIIEDGQIKVGYGGT
jgi:glutaredoxin